MTRWTTNAEIECLQKYSRLAKLGIVEIGVFDGETTAEIAKVSSVPIYGIDPIIPDSMPPHEVGSLQKISRNMNSFRNFVFYRDYSYNVVKKFSHQFDFIFIDGSHVYEDVKKDFEDWFPKLVTQGIIAFHDTAPVTSIPADFKGWEGPTQLVKELKETLEFLETVDTLTVFKK